MAISAAGIIFSSLNANTLSRLTSDRTVAAIPFGCRYRLIDFCLSNMVNADISNINIVANYKIEGRVVDTYDYLPSEKGIYNTETMLNAISHRDIGLTWGFLAEGTNHRKVRWSSIGNRHLEFTAETDFLNEHGGTEEVTKYWSNNHLIASTDKIYEDINKIKVGDYVVIEGELVNLMCELTSNTFIKYNTSTNRIDKGTGACEVIYVTKIEWK